MYVRIHTHTYVHVDETVPWMDLLIRANRIHLIFMIIIVYAHNHLCIQKTCLKSRQNRLCYIHTHRHTCEWRQALSLNFIRSRYMCMHGALLWHMYWTIHRMYTYAHAHTHIHAHTHKRICIQEHKVCLMFMHKYLYDTSGYWYIHVHIDTYIPRILLC